MRELGHTWIDVLKIDIEGAEWDALAGQLAMPGPLPFTQIQVCMGWHHWMCWTLYHAVEVELTRGMCRCSHSHPKALAPGRRFLY